MIQDIKTVTVSSKRQIAIPTSFDKVHPGDKVLVQVEDDKVVIRPIKKAYEPALLSDAALRKAWSSKEDEAAFAYLQDK
jgi:virulence-associated protein VagC